MTATVRIDQAAMAELLESIDGPVGKEILRRTLAVERAAKRLCPVDTGRLRSSITHEIQKDGRGLVGVVGTNVSYAAYVEFGTSRMRAQPYLRPALAEASR